SVKVNGTCGSADGAVLSSKPTTNLCSKGTPSTVAGSGPWTWSCTGEGGGSDASCKASVKVNGVCGSADGAGMTSKPTTNLCSKGTPSTVAGSGPWTWSCAGENGGGNASCKALLKVNGNCGSADGAVLASKPTTNLCSKGTPSTVAGSGPWTWTCQGQNGGSSVSCKALAKINGICGSADGVGRMSKPTSNLCSKGTASTVSGSGPWTWTCEGEGGGSDASCEAPLKVNGVCGSADGVGRTSKPTSNLCSKGTASSVAGSGPWTWTCAGQNGGSTASCEAPLKVNGSCGSSDDKVVASKPSGTKACSAGTISGMTGSNPWSWTCSGKNGGTSASCATLAPPECGSAATTTESEPTSNLCKTGTASDVKYYSNNETHAWYWYWTCTKNGSSLTCKAPKCDCGMCGDAQGKKLASMPTKASDLCSNGTPSSVTTTASGWTWTCTTPLPNTRNCSAFRK
ncbi:MAG: hypothetical protein PHW76_09095, partial [Alphaproteobacteria bacterium]|nr:hypothetical protein [Alphaproteobacteria bacterium]